MGCVLSEAKDSSTIKWPCDIAEYFSLIAKQVKKYSMEQAIAVGSSEARANLKDTFSKRQTDNPMSDIPWKDTILEHLTNEYSKGREWVPSLYRLIKAESFYTESNWQSLFFWEEFQLRTKPSCLIKKVKRKSYPQSDYFYYNVEHNSKKKDITADFKVFQERMYEYIRILKEHISHNGHPFNFIISNFTVVFNQYLKKTIIKLSALNKANSDDFITQSITQCENITEQLVSFINVIEEALSMMYRKTYSSSVFIEEKDEIINLISGLLFNDSSLYKYMITLIRMSLSLEISEYYQRLEASKSITPDSLGVPPKLCLNNLSLQYYKEKLNGKQPVPKELDPPYQNSIGLLKTIGKYKKPYDKLLLIYKMSHTISDCVNDFWNRVDSSLALKSFGVDSDDLLNTLEYILIKSQMSDLLTHMKFVKSFTSTKTRSTMIGYYFSSLEVSISKITSFKEPHLNSSSSSSSSNDSQSIIIVKQKKAKDTQEAHHRK